MLGVIFGNFHCFILLSFFIVVFSIIGSTGLFR
uniref:Uncharacterized protein n=1 Tax=Rhizophora mucronata TaxID=61149 RepID=A0A2P2IV66_RHIMU